MFILISVLMMIYVCVIRSFNTMFDCCLRPPFTVLTISRYFKMVTFHLETAV